MIFNRHSNEYRDGKRDGEMAYSDLDYDRSQYSSYGSEEQCNYTAGFDQAREDAHYQERMDEERKEEERQEQRAQEIRAEQRRQEEYEEQMFYEQQQQFEEPTP